MATLGLQTATDIASLVLTDFVRGPVLSQTTEDKPLLAYFNRTKKTFPGGKDNISLPIQGNYMSDTPGFRQGYTQDDALIFGQSSNALRVAYPWKEIFYGLIITWTELKQDGLTITDNNKVSRHTDRDLIVLTDILENRLDDYKESMQRMQNDMYWRDGSTDSKIVPGVLSLITDTPATGTTGGLSRTTNAWWRNQAAVNANAITPSANDQTLTRYLRKLVRQLVRYQGKPAIMLAGEIATEALELEVQAKGIYTQEGFTNEGKTDIGLAQIRMRGMGTFMYDPTLDDMGISNRIYILGSKLKLQPMDQEDMKILQPTRPYNYAVYLQGVTWTGGLPVQQLTDCAVIEVNFNPGV